MTDCCCGGFLEASEKSDENKQEREKQGTGPERSGEEQKSLGFYSLLLNQDMQELCLNTRTPTSTHISSVSLCCFSLRGFFEPSARKPSVHIPHIISRPYRDVPYLGSHRSTGIVFFFFSISRTDHRQHDYHGEDGWPR